MTLFITTHKRTLEISDAYIMALTFMISFGVGKIFKAVIEKQKRKNPNTINLVNPGGGALEFSDDAELGHTILTCITDNERYLVKDPKIINIVFALVKAKIKKESLVITPNMMRFLALKLIKYDQPLIIKIGNIVASSNMRARLFTRVAISTVIGFASALFVPVLYAILMLAIFFKTTENCGYKCSKSFERLPKEGPTQIYGEESTGHIFIAGNVDAQQIEIYIPSKAAGKVVVSNNGQLKTTKTYTKSRRKAKEVRFSDFKQTDPVLSSFKELKEPEIPQKICPINDVHDFIGIRVKE